MKLTLAFLRCIYIKFSDNFFNYRKTWFHVNGVNNYFIILCIFPNISFWRQSLFFPSFFWNQNRLGFKKILEIKLSDKSLVSEEGWKRNKGKPTDRLNKQWHCSITTRSVFIINTFISIPRLKLAKSRAKVRQQSEAELLLFENYSLFFVQA